MSSTTTHESYVGAIDQGTTGTRFMVFDVDGHVVANAYRTHEQHYPKSGWVEHDAAVLWENTKSVVREVLGQSDVSADQLAAIGVANQRETTVLWDDETGEPVGNAIVWQDRRTTERVEQLRSDGKVETIRQKTGLEPDAYFSATKAEWLFEHGDGNLLERARAGDVRFGTVDSWLIYKLTGAHVTDVTNASRTMLYNIRDLEWDAELLAEFDVPRAALPEVRPSSDETAYGYTDPDGFIGAAVPVCGALGDQQAALFGQTCFEPGEAKNTYGTGSFVLMNTGEEPVGSEHGLLTTVAFGASGEPVQYALEGSIFNTGAAIEWLEDVGFVGDPAETERLAREAESTDGVYVVPAFTGLGAPHWDQRARGTIIGITRGTRCEHVVRATLESIAYQTRDIAEAMESDSGIEMSSLRVDGGAVKNDFLCQLQADIIGSEIVRPVVDETTALGAAYAAGLAVGYWDSLESLRKNWHVDRTFDPDLAVAEADRKYDRWQDAVDRSRGWARE